MIHNTFSNFIIIVYIIIYYKWCYHNVLMSIILFYGKPYIFYLRASTDKIRELIKKRV